MIGRAHPKGEVEWAELSEDNYLEVLQWVGETARGQVEFDPDSRMLIMPGYAYVKMGNIVARINGVFSVWNPSDFWERYETDTVQGTLIWGTDERRDSPGLAAGGHGPARGLGRGR